MKNGWTIFGKSELFLLTNQQHFVNRKMSKKYGKCFVIIWHNIFAVIKNVLWAYLILELSVNKKVPTRFVIIYNVNLRVFISKIVNYAHKKRFQIWTFDIYGNKNKCTFYIVETDYGNNINVQINVQFFVNKTNLC